ncbi:MAG: VWA domain-containing protein, partial [Proteobacteria bacterium]|nr:VWA domain-containing protein [Pseudomonadota bacterium]
RAAGPGREARVQREKPSLETRLSDLQRELYKYSDDIPDEKQDRHKAGFTVEEIEGEAPADGRKIELQYGGDPIEIPENIQQLLESISQDLGNIPDDYLQTEAPDPDQDEASSGPPPQAASSQDSEATWLYDEWDHSRQKYRKEWCRLKELEVQPVHDGFVSRTLDKHRGLLKHLHRTFESLREDDRRIKRQPYGDDVDLDAVIEAFSDTRIGLEASQNLFTRSRKVDRNIAVMFMIDMSGSTAGWVNEMEREALVLLCESLEILGDRYSIYGFSGFTHERCELYRIKEFEEPYSDLVKARISGIQAQGYTRMGAAVRHLTSLLHQVEARTKLLIALSDGRPDDQDGYRGPYGIEDTRRALIEAKYLGVHPFCITIDEEAMDYLQHMYGPASFTVVDDVDKLPYRVSDIYRRIAF